VDWASVAGILLALAGLFIGHSLDGGKLASLLQPAAFAIVVVGTFGAVLLQTPGKTFRRGISMLSWVFNPPPSQRSKLGAQINGWTQTARRDGLLSLEAHMGYTKDKFIKKGLRLIVDGIHPDKVRSIMEVELSAYELAERSAVKVWEAAAGYAPTIGILGAVLGLIHVMENLSDPTRLGGGIAIAFVSTVYGVGLANLLFYPVANKLKGIVGETVIQYEIVLDAMLDIASGDYSRVIEERVASLVNRP
jgi:chemotaxis protein MotA